MSYWAEYHAKLRKGLCVQASCKNMQSLTSVRCEGCAKVHRERERARMRKCCRGRKIKPKNYRKKP